MSSSTVLRALNRLLALHYRSVPRYLSYTRPWTTRSDEETQKVLDYVVSDQQYLIDRLARLIIELGGTPDRGHGRDLTHLNDLSLEFLLQRVIDYQRQDIEIMEQCSDDLSEHTEGSALAQEALGMARGHLESMEEVSQATTGTS